MTTQIQNILQNLPDARIEECITTLLTATNLRLERIVSHGQSTAEGFWYDQKQREWVIVLHGSAALRFEGEDTPRLMGVGDYVDIPAHCRHRVEWTDTKTETVWLAVHFDH